MSESTQTNSYAIVSFTFGILAIFLPFIGFFLGIAGIVVSRKATKEIHNTDQTGKGLAISGLICSIVGMIMQFLIMLGILAFVTFKGG
ncbi:MAG TPA: DUF4190 domain-containing protein [Lentibacillus sp.]|uniref:DUF4190 domain-containing protein n=1 Tax=Lentibacillus sp. TaxID=1925746 RepID=UPI002B4B72DD|nr:DUF4190 domain-containing protein [Lentibacillus sp.]HLR61953.1 DUF4190 domain-containing protein [Lentibacillus sp.]